LATTPTLRTRLAGPGTIALALALGLHGAMLISLLREVSAARHGERAVPRMFHLFNDAVHRLGPGADFFALYHATVQVERHEDVFAGNRDGITPPYYVYRYMPLLAQLARPFVRLLSPWSAYLVWIGILELGLAAGMWMTGRLFAGSPWVPWLQALWPVFTPFWLELQMGQFTFLSGLLLMATGFLLRRGRPGLAQLPWVSSVLVKVFGLVLLPLWWRLRLLHLALAGLAVLAVLALLFGDLGSWRTFVDVNLSAVRMGTDDTGNFGFSFFTMLATVAGGGLPLKAWPVVYRVMWFGWLGAATLLVIRRRDVPPLSAIAVLVLAHHLSYMHVWEHHSSALLPLGMLLLRDQRGRWAAVVVAALVVLALPSPFFVWDDPDGPWGAPAAWPLWERMCIVGSKAIPAVVLFVAGARTCWRGVEEPA
jgi:hypothetical protein